MLFHCDLGAIFEDDLVRCACIFLGFSAIARATRSFGVGVPGRVTVALKLIVSIGAGFIHAGIFFLFLCDVFAVIVVVGVVFTVYATVLLFLVDKVAGFPVTLSESFFDLLPREVDLAMCQPDLTPMMH